MKLYDIWKRIGKQPLKKTRNTDALVFTKDKEYVIIDIVYENDRIVGFEAISNDTRKD